MENCFPHTRRTLRIHRHVVGLRNAPSTFQRLMTKLLKACIDEGFVEVYIDNILFHSTNESNHKKHIATVLQILLDNHLFCNAQKCHFFIKPVIFIGLVITPEGISMDQEKVKANQSWQAPKTLK